MKRLILILALLVAPQAWGQDGSAMGFWGAVSSTGGGGGEPSTPTIDANYPYTSSTAVSIGGGGSDVDANRWKFTIPATSGPTTIIVGISYFSSADPNTCGTAQALHSTGLTWNALGYIYANGASTQFFWAAAASAISATELGFWAGWGAACTGTFDQNHVTVWALHGACGSGVGAYTTWYDAFNAMNKSFTTTGAGSSYTAFAIGDAANESSTLVAVTGSTAASTYDGTSMTAMGGNRTSLSSGPGSFTVGATISSSFGWGMAALEVLPASCL